MYYNIDYEAFLLASLLNSDNGVFSVIIDILEPNDFYFTKHRELYTAMLEVYKSNTPLRQLDHPAYKPLIGFIADIYDSGIELVKENAISYAESVKFYSNLRSLDRIAIDIKNLIRYRNDDDISEAVSNLRKKLDDIFIKKISNVHTISDGYSLYKEMVSANNPIVVKTGVPDIDNPSRGLIPGEVAEIISRPYVGKSLFAQNMQVINWLRYKIPSIYFSYEMSINSLTERALAIYLGKRYTDIERMSSEGAAEIDDALRKLRGIYFVESYGMTIDDIQKVVMAHPGVRLIFIDYLGLISCARKDRYNKISELADALKPLAMRTNTVVVVLSQINRTGGDGSVRVTLNMPSDSTQVEAAADVVIGMWRNSMNKDVRIISLLKARRGYITEKEIPLMFRNGSCALVPVEEQ